MSASNPFTPNNAGTVTLTANTTSASVPVSIPDPGFNQQLLVQNATATVPAFIEFTTGTVPGFAATTVSTPLLGGQSYTFSVGESITHASVISAGTATIYITCGRGGTPT